MKYVKHFSEALQKVLEIDPALKSVADQHQFPQFRIDNVRPPSFQYITQSIISQQVSGHAAKAITAKFCTLFDGEGFPSPEQVVAKEVDELRQGGLSNAKANSVKGLAQAFVDGRMSDQIFAEADDDRITDLLCEQKGIGPWSAQMFLLFYVQRMDVFSPADIGVQRGFKRYLKFEGCDHLKTVTTEDVPEEDLRPKGTIKKALQKVKVPDECKHMAAVASKFKPYRSVFQLLMWKISDTIVEIGKDTSSSRNARVAKSQTNGSKKKKGAGTVEDLPTQSEDVAENTNGQAASGIDKPNVQDAASRRKRKAPTQSQATSKKRAVKARTSPVTETLEQAIAEELTDNIDADPPAYLGVEPVDQVDSEDGPKAIETPTPSRARTRSRRVRKSTGT